MEIDLDETSSETCETETSSTSETTENATVPDSGPLPITPIPETPDVGKAFGEPILVGGADLHASSATVVSYDSPEGPRTVLHTLVAEEAEEKLLEALHIAQTLVPTQVEQTVHGRLPIDTKNELADKIITAAKSVNHHVGAGSITAGTAPVTTEQKVKDAELALTTVEATVGAEPSAAEAAMLAHYQQKLNAINHAVATATTVDPVEPFLHEGTTVVTRMMPALPPEASGDEVVAVLREATRIKPTLDSATGQASWDGKARWDGATGKEYAIDLGDGFHAVYRPYSLNDPNNSEYSLRGRLEIVAPAGKGHGPDVVRRLGQLNLANCPMTHDEGEYSYLTANITAQELGGHSGIEQAMITGKNIEDMVRQELFHERAHQAVGMTDTELAHFAKDLQLEAHTWALPAKVKVLRDAVASATGHASGAELAASPGYDPAPRRNAGWLSWSRFDVGNRLGELSQAVNGRSLVHQTSAKGLKAMLATGVFASTERRTLMGITRGMGMSEEQDKLTGGASSVFLRIKDTSSIDGGPKLIWDKPERLLARADYYGANADTYGVVNPAKKEVYVHSTRDPFKIAKFHAETNEVMFGDGIDLLGAEGPSRIICNSHTQRKEIHAMLTAKGVTHIAGKPIDDVLKV
ncbi:hypothetical protein [Amycolatopsis sp. NPDC059657]|uniref:hypothetical protein n=1 Tax=Amycolatopsis sp. NPDC059657 TaxID=3346899 RepID=UPI00366BBA73